MFKETVSRNGLGFLDMYGYPCRPAAASDFEHFLRRRKLKAYQYLQSLCSIKIAGEKEGLTFTVVGIGSVPYFPSAIYTFSDMTTLLPLSLSVSSLCVSFRGRVAGDNSCGSKKVCSSYLILVS
jgi:hypothetical protein